MRTVGVLLAGLLLAGLGWPQSASAESEAVPPGTYLRTCGEAYLQGGTLIAACRRVNGSARPTALPAVQYCVGDIGNLNGALTCTYAGAPTPLLPYFAPGNPPRPDG
jgi:hypothetical protein